MNINSPAKSEIKGIENESTKIIIGAALEAHKELGPGLLESTYETCLVYELLNHGCKVERQKDLPVLYKEHRIECGYRIDLLVNEKVVVELKSVVRIENIHKAQLLSYLKLSQCKVGLLINFNEKLLMDGICRMVL